MQVEEYFTYMPAGKVPRTNSAGEKYRERQILLQLPRQDLAVDYCKHVGGNQERKLFEDFINNRNETALDIGYVCPAFDRSTVSRRILLHFGDDAVDGSTYMFVFRSVASAKSLFDRAIWV